MTGSERPLLLMSLVLAFGVLCNVASAKVYTVTVTEVFSADGPRHTTGYPTTIGGSFSFNNDLKDGSGNVIGFLNGVCIIAAEPSQEAGIPEIYYECTQTAAFTKGEYEGSSLTQSAFVVFSSSLPLAIMGGTGKFLGATGALYQSPDPSNPSGASTDLFVFRVPDDLPAPPTTGSAPTTGAQPTLQKMTFWRRDNASYGLARHVPVWTPDKLRNGDTDSFNDDLYDADMSDMSKGNKIGYQAGTCTLVSTPGDGSDRQVYVCYSIFVFDPALIGTTTPPNSIETDIITCTQISTSTSNDNVSLETLVITGGGGKYFGAQGVMHHDEVGGVFEAYYYLPYDVSVDPKGLISTPTSF